MNTDAFFRYARARYEIFLKRKQGLPRPWSDDPIFQTKRFTNVFREDDKVTVWFRENVRDPMRSRPEVMLATVVFRLTTRPEVGDAWFLKKLNGSSAFDLFLCTGDVEMLKRAFIAYIGEPGLHHPVTTNAYNVFTPPGMPKLDGVLKMIHDFYRTPWIEFASRCLDRSGTMRLQDAFEFFKQPPFVGNFHAYEFVTDLRHTDLLRNAPDIDTWANIGQGSERGLARITGLREINGKGHLVGRYPREQAVDEMKGILLLSREPSNWPRKWPRWELRDVEHLLCEFDKYERISRDCH